VTGPGAGLGERLRRARLSRRLSIDDTAAAAGLTKGYLSKVERGLNQPSSAVLLRVCAALGLAPGDLLRATTGRDLIRVRERTAVSFGGVGLTESLLTPAHERRLQVLHSHVAPGGGSGSEQYALPCEVEFVFLVSGQLVLTISQTEVTLDAGDTLTLAAGEAHSFRNPSATVSAQVLWVLVPALPSDTGQGDPDGG